MNGCNKECTRFTAIVLSHYSCHQDSHLSLNLYFGFSYCVSLLKTSHNFNFWPTLPCLSSLPLSPNQLLIEIIDASSVITWDFDMCKGDVVFNIYHSKRAPQPPRKDPLGPHGITSPVGNNVQLIDKSWTLGQDYSMVESPLICKEGESVQVRFQDCKLTRNGLNILICTFILWVGFCLSVLIICPLLRAPMLRGGQVSTSSSGSSTACRPARPQTYPEWTTCWPPCRSPHISAKSCSTLRCWALRTSG